jgi:hypothetical protein
MQTTCQHQYSKNSKNQILSDKQKTAEYYRWYKEAQLPISSGI